MDPYEEVAQQGQVPPLSPAYVPDPMLLDEHVPVYVSEPEQPEYHAPSDDDIQGLKDEDCLWIERIWRHWEGFLCVEWCSSGGEGFNRNVTPGVPNVTKDKSIESESMSWGNDEDDNNDEEGSEQENDSEEHESDFEQDIDGSESDSESDKQDDNDEVKDDDDDDEVKDDDENDDNDDDQSKGDEDKGMDSDDVQDEKADVRMTDAQHEKENLEIAQEQVVKDAHVTITKRTEVPVTSSFRSSDLASEFLIFLDIPLADKEIISPLDVYVHHEEKKGKNLGPSMKSCEALMNLSTPSPLPTTETINIPSSILDFASVFRFNDRVIALETNVVELKNGPLHTQVTVLVDDHLDTSMGAAREEFMNFFLESLTNSVSSILVGILPLSHSSPSHLRTAISNYTVSLASDGTSEKKERTVTVTADNMQRMKNDVKARTTLLLSLHDEHQLRFSKYKTAQELWVAILKTFGGNEATKKTKMILLKQQYGNFKAEGAETLEQTFNRLSDLDTMSLDDLYNHLKVYESKVQKKSEPNPQNMAFISSAKHSRGNEDVTTASVSTASTNVPTASTNVGVASISQDTACAYIASQSSGSQIKFDDMEEIDIKWSMDLLSMRADNKITDLTDKLFDANNMIYHYKLGLAQVESRLVEHREIKYCEKIRGLELDVEFKSNSLECLAKKLETLKKENEGLDGKLAGFQTASKDLDSLLKSQRLDKNKEGLGYSDDDTVTDYSRPASTVESSPDDAQNRNSFVTKEASPCTISPKSFIKFVKENDSPSKSKIDKDEKAKKSSVKKFPTGGTKFHTTDMGKKGKAVKPSDSGCSRHMTGNISYLFDFEPSDGGYVSFGQGGCKITRKGTIKTGKLEYENVYFVKDLKYNLFSVSQICDNKNSVLLTDSECIMLGRDFKLLDDANILLRTPR
nr:ribonuclease H-like domain-containing protein [Tanacetum cinerariifolium]